MHPDLSFRITSALNPEFADAYKNRGNLYFEQNKWDLALPNFNQAKLLHSKLSNHSRVASSTINSAILLMALFLISHRRTLENF
ncbi:MAG: tetratricopeptide repeat protein [Rhizonema sp. NSF051]|nr:tetratricopeptide repeat protein [Rhizonema sp. NSF051]